MAATVVDSTSDSTVACTMFRAVLAGAGILASLGGCTKEDPGPPLTPITITKANAVMVASEALVTNANLGSTGLVGSPAAGAKAAVAALPALQRAAVSQLRRAAPAEPMIDACGISGTVTTVAADSAAGTTRVTFENCVETAGISMNGTLKYTGLALTPSDSALALSATVDSDVTITQGELGYAETGGYTLDFTLMSTPTTGLSSEVFDLHGDKLDISVTMGGAPLERIMLAGFDVHFEVDLTAAPERTTSTISYTVASSRLAGEITVATTAPLAQLTEPATPRRFPYTGRLTISGISGTRLQVTVLGDESYTPPASQAQVELQLDMGFGSFGAPIWASWDALSATATATE